MDTVVELHGLPMYTVGGKPDWGLIPEHMIGGLRRYIENGIEPGHFLEAVLCNNLKGSVAYSDGINKHRLVDYVTFLHNFAPMQCWGSVERYEAWIKQGGLGWTEVADG